MYYQQQSQNRPTNPLCSVILTSYNRTWQLKDAIESVLNQNLPDFELFIIDDGSKQETRDICIEYANKDDRIIYIQTDVKEEDRKVGTGPCRYAMNINYCAKLARGKYITYLTDDDIHLPNHLIELSLRLDYDNKILAIYASQILEILDNNYNIIKILERGVSKNPLKNGACIVDHNSFMHRKEVYGTVGFWPEEPEHWGSADAGFFQKLEKANIWLYPANVITSVHRWHEYSLQNVLGILPKEVFKK